MKYENFKCESRRGIRCFDEKPVSKEDVLKLLELARLAPGVENLQPWHFHVILNKELRHTLIEASYYGGADVFVLITANGSLENEVKEPVWNPQELEYSCMAAAEHMMLGCYRRGEEEGWNDRQRRPIEDMYAFHE